MGCLRLGEEIRVDESQINKFQKVVPYLAVRVLRKRVQTSSNIFIRLKKIYNVTPISLRLGQNAEVLFVREFAIYLHIHYSNLSIEEIGSLFSCSIEYINKIKDDRSLKKKYKHELIQYASDLRAELYFRYRNRLISRMRLKDKV